MHTINKIKDFFLLFSGLHLIRKVNNAHDRHENGNCPLH